MGRIMAHDGKRWVEVESWSTCAAWPSNVMFPLGQGKVVTEMSIWKCRYCGSSVNQEKSKCPSCGANKEV